jgi:transcriptional regulator of acetoin/glycerol metabolism
MASPPSIQVHDLPSYLSQRNRQKQEFNFEILSYRDAKEKILEKFEQDYLKSHLMKNDWNITRTAETCGIDRRTIHRLIKKYQLKAN